MFVCLFVCLFVSYPKLINIIIFFLFIDLVGAGDSLHSPGNLLSRSDPTPSHSIPPASVSFLSDGMKGMYGHTHPGFVISLTPGKFIFGICMGLHFLFLFLLLYCMFGSNSVCVCVGVCVCVCHVDGSHLGPPAKRPHQDGGCRPQPNLPSQVTSVSLSLPFPASGRPELHLNQCRTVGQGGTEKPPERSHGHIHVLLLLPVYHF